MSWSLNEIETLSRKAARGSGLSWGLADEAGKASRWLCAMGLPGPETLAALLTRNDGSAYAALCPLETGQTWAASGGQLCPLISGALICDRAADLAQGQTIELGETSYPLLLLPYVAAAAALADTPLTVEWQGVSARFDSAAHLHADARALETAHAPQVRIKRAPTAESGQPLAPASRGEMAPETAHALQAFAHRTYAPDTPESRLAGAGAGLTDND